MVAESLLYSILSLDLFIHRLVVSLLITKLKQQPSPDCLTLFQHHNLLPWKTINDNIRIGLQQKISDEEINAQLKLVDLEDRESIFPSNCPGMKQRVALMSSACA